MTHSQGGASGHHLHCVAGPTRQRTLAPGTVTITIPHAGLETLRDTTGLRSRRPTSPPRNAHRRRLAAKPAGSETVTSTTLRPHRPARRAHPFRSYGARNATPARRTSPHAVNSAPGDQRAARRRSRGSGTVVLDNLITSSYSDTPTSPGDRDDQHPLTSRVRVAAATPAPRDIASYVAALRSARRLAGEYHTVLAP